MLEVLLSIHKGSLGYPQDQWRIQDPPLLRTTGKAWEMTVEQSRVKITGKQKQDHTRPK